MVTGPIPVVGCTGLLIGLPARLVLVLVAVVALVPVLVLVKGCVVTVTPHMSFHPDEGRVVGGREGTIVSIKFVEATSVAKSKATSTSGSRAWLRAKSRDRVCISKGWAVGNRVKGDGAMVVLLDWNDVLVGAWMSSVVVVVGLM